MNAIDLLRQQHTEVASNFQRALRSTGEEQLNLLTEIVQALMLHTAIEEQHLYPVFRQHGLDEAAEESIREHQQVRALISELMSLSQSDTRVVSLMERLDRSVREHVAKEEGELFPWLKARLSDEDLDDLGQAMQRLADELRQRGDLVDQARQGESLAPA